MMHAAPYTIVLLAAGASTRLGRPKQLVRYGGDTLLGRAVETARAAAPADVLVVTGANAELLSDELERLEVATVHNADWASGIGSSVRAGVQAALLRAGDAAAHRGVLLMLCDQPLLTASHLRELMTAARVNGIAAASSYPDGTLGVPAAFAPPLLLELLALQPEQGAKPVLTRHGADVAAVPFPDGVLDVDTEADVSRLAGRPDAPSVL
jgi:molybdenum cofactor cytidylyltransferase